VNPTLEKSLNTLSAVFREYSRLSYQTAPLAFSAFQKRNLKHSSVGPRPSFHHSSFLPVDKSGFHDLEAPIQTVFGKAGP
jgi:hypothetical protein